jgi:hypothetical protein
MFEGGRNVSVEQDAADLKKLGEYMEEAYGGLKPGRSVASYALEFLKTEQANRQYFAACSDLTAAASNLEYYLGWVETEIAKIPKLAEKVVALKKLKEVT